MATHDQIAAVGRNQTAAVAHHGARRGLALGHAYGHSETKKTDDTDAAAIAPGLYLRRGYVSAKLARPSNSGRSRASQPTQALMPVTLSSETWRRGLDGLTPAAN